MAQAIATFYTYDNVGATTILSKDGATNLYENVGATLSHYKAGAANAYENIGVTLFPQTEPAMAYEYIVPLPVYIGWGMPIR